jgi:hypothetical protein
VITDTKNDSRPSVTDEEAIYHLAGFFFTDGPFWAEQRRFSLRQLRELGFGKKSLEGIILEEAEEFVKQLAYNEVQVSTSADSRRKTPGRENCNISGNSYVFCVAPSLVAKTVLLGLRVDDWIWVWDPDGRIVTRKYRSTLLGEKSFPARTFKVFESHLNWSQKFTVTA